jgi:hypothetical protein
MLHTEKGQKNAFSILPYRRMAAEMSGLQQIKVWRDAPER